MTTLKISDAATKHSVSTSTVRRWVRDGYLPKQARLLESHQLSPRHAMAGWVGAERYTNAIDARIGELAQSHKPAQWQQWLSTWRG